MLLFSTGLTTYFDDIQAKLRATGAFTAVDAINLLDQDVPSGLLLSQYDSLLVWYFGYGSKADNARDLLVSYFESGGRVVTADTSVFDAGSFRKYMVSAYNGQNRLYTNNGLGSIDEPPSPLMAGVHQIDFPRWFISGLDTRNGGVVVARWRTGDPFVVRGTINGRSRVDLNFPPESHDGDDWYGWIGDGAILIKNALLYK